MNASKVTQLEAQFASLKVNELGRHHNSFMVPPWKDLSFQREILRKLVSSLWFSIAKLQDVHHYWHQKSKLQFSHNKIRFQDLVQ